MKKILTCAQKKLLLYVEQPFAQSAGIACDDHIDKGDLYMDSKRPEQHTTITKGTDTAKDEGEHSKMTISDVAEALNISKTTVSRAISGKGRIGAETRRRVLEYIEEHNYKPSVIAKGLAQSKSYNIGWVMPSDYSVVDLPFFQKCLMGLLEMAAPVDYDVLPA